MISCTVSYKHPERRKAPIRDLEERSVSAHTSAAANGSALHTLRGARPCPHQCRDATVDRAQATGAEDGFLSQQSNTVTGTAVSTADQDKPRSYNSKQ